MNSVYLQQLTLSPTRDNRHLLQQALRYYLHPNAGEKVPVDRLLSVALSIEDWPVIMRLCKFVETKFACASHPSDSARLYNLQLWRNAAQLSGKTDTCQDLNRKMAFLFPHQQQNQQPELPSCNQPDPDALIKLVPLSPNHCQAFAWIYSDDIAKRCNLPVFTSNEEWLQWYQYACDDPLQHLYAIVHRDWGMIGMLCLEIENNLGFFYYWIGKDFQKQGFGTQALQLLLTLGFNNLGMSSCYAKVFKSNVASQKTLAKLGFTALPFAAPAPYDDEFFYYLGPNKAWDRQFQEARAVFFKFEPGRTFIPLDFSQVIGKVN